MTQNHLFTMPPDVTPEPEPEDDGAVKLSTREISRFVTYYKKNVRNHSLTEQRGVFGAIQRLLAGNKKKGQRPLLPQEIADALKNYANDTFVKASDERLRKHMRSFFTYEVVTAWLKPIRKDKPQDSAIQQLENAGQRMRVAPLPAVPTITNEEEDETPKSF